MVRLTILIIILLFIHQKVVPEYHEYMQNYWWVQAQKIKLEIEWLDVEKAKLCFSYGWCEGPFAPKPLPKKKDKET